MWTTPCHVVHWRGVSPRLMFGAVQLRNGANLTVIVAHAPHMQCPVEVRDDFWAQLWDLTTEVKQRYPDSHFRLALDANARLGSMPSAHAGSAECVTENANGVPLRTYADEFHMYAVNTFWKASPS